MIRSLICLLTVGLALAVTSQAWAGHGFAGADGCCCEVQCPKCHHVCKVSVDKAKVEKYCWEVECEPICIPRVHFPWECACPPKCAKVKYVNKLKKKTYECEVCEYSWTPEEVCCGGCGGACGGDGCCAQGCDVSGDVVSPAQPEPAQPEPTAEAQTAPEPSMPLTGQRPSWLKSAKNATSSTATLPVRFLRAAKRQIQE